MYAVIKTGGKQYRVEEGQILDIESIVADPGSKIEFDEVLMVADGEKITIGTPIVDKGKVTASVVEHGRGKKIDVIKFKRRKQYMKRTGHRQNFTKVKIEKISA